jgi:serine/threonine protein kinase
MSAFNDFSASSPSSVDTLMLCPVCHAENPNRADVCRSCGSPLTVGAPSPHLLPPGSKLLNGFYAVGKPLGQGGFGITYLGSDVKQRLSVAIKEFFPQGSVRQNRSVYPAGTLDEAGFKEAKERFIQEGVTLKQFRHPGIVRVYALFEENNTAYMVMEYLRGETLQKRLEERGPLPEKEAIGYIMEVGDALATVHRANLLHRDVKPENIIVTDTGRVALIDFGAAKEFAAGKTQAHSLLLTPGYAPLEQYAQRAHRGAFTDVYALGATLYHLLTGQAPVAATDRAAGVELPSPIQLNPNVSSSVSHAVMRALDMKVDQRPQTIPDFLVCLRLPKPEPAPAFQAPQWRWKRQTGPEAAPPSMPPPPSHAPPPPMPHRPPPFRPSPPPATAMERIGVLPLLSEYSSTLGVWAGGVIGGVVGLLHGGPPGAVICGLLGWIAGRLLGMFLPYAVLLTLCIYPYIRESDTELLPVGVLIFIGLLFLGLLPIHRRRRR